MWYAAKDFSFLGREFLVDGKDNEEQGWKVAGR